ETGRNIHLDLMAGALRGEGYGRSLGRFIEEDGVTLPTVEELENQLRGEPAHPLTPARAELLQVMTVHKHFGITSRSPFIRALATTSFPIIRCSTARLLAVRLRWTLRCLDAR